MFKRLLLGENIKKYRKKAQLTQTQLAEKMFVSTQAISNWERGLTPPDLENLCRLSAFFHVSVDSLLGKNEFLNEKLMIGIDGGGTKTEFILFTESGKIVHRLKLSQSNPNDIGMENCCGVLAEGIDLLLEKAPAVCGIFAGIAGGSTGGNQAQLAAFFKKRYPRIHTEIDSDAVNVLYSDMDSTADMALICGTGSVLFARKNGKNHRIGGWGYLFDGAGSAYDIGCAAVKAALAEADGLGPGTAITELLKQRTQSDIWGGLSKIYQGGKAYIASFAPLVFEAYALNDPAAADILKENCRHLTSLIAAAQRQYRCGNRVVACGGLFENYKEILLPMLQTASPPATQFVFPSLPPVYGACAACCHQLGICPGKDFYEHFYQDYQRITRSET